MRWQIHGERAVYESPFVELHLADYLTEQGDPRGEFMQVQLALEEETKSAAERKKLRREAWEAYKAAHVVHLGEGVYWNDEDDYDKWDLENAEAKLGDSDAVVQCQL